MLEAFDNAGDEISYIILIILTVRKDKQCFNVGSCFLRIPYWYKTFSRRLLSQRATPCDLCHRERFLIIFTSSWRTLYKTITMKICIQPLSFLFLFYLCLPNLGNHYLQKAIYSLERWIFTAFLDWYKYRYLCFESLVGFFFKLYSESYDKLSKQWCALWSRSLYDNQINIPQPLYPKRNPFMSIRYNTV